jgi:uncharacterized membrane protein YgdD (TMEM256/DUF423 family)
MTGAKWIMVSGILGAVSVLIGAFGAHGFEKFLSRRGFTAEQIHESSEWLETGVRYHFYHTLAILGVGLLAVARPDWRLAPAGFCFVVGIVLFSGVLYVMAMTHVRVLGAVVPIGGLALTVGWILLAMAGR